MMTEAPFIQRPLVMTAFVVHTEPNTAGIMLPCVILDSMLAFRNQKAMTAASLLECVVKP